MNIYEMLGEMVIEGVKDISPLPDHLIESYREGLTFSADHLHFKEITKNIFNHTDTPPTYILCTESNGTLDEAEVAQDFSEQFIHQFKRNHAYKSPIYIPKFDYTLLKRAERANEQPNAFLEKLQQLKDVDQEIKREILWFDVNVEDTKHVQAVIIF